MYKRLYIFKYKRLYTCTRDYIFKYKRLYSNRTDKYSQTIDYIHRSQVIQETID